MLKKLVKTTAILGTLSYVAYKTIANKTIERIFSRQPVKNLEDIFEGDELIEKQKEHQKYLNWICSSKTEKVFINAFDGTKLCGLFVENNKTNNYIICAHGWGGCKENHYSRAYNFSKLKYNCLLIDQRGAGESEYHINTFGLKESVDLVQWIDFICKRNNKANIILYGVSMGAATVMMALNSKLPNNVKCVIEDCGYADYKDELAHVLKNEYNLSNVKPIINIVNSNIKNKYNFTLDDIKPIDALKNNTIPLLIIHGESDDFVPFENAKLLYNANLGEKKYYPVKNCGHGLAHTTKSYYDIINKFIKNYI